MFVHVDSSTASDQLDNPALIDKIPEIDDAADLMSLLFLLHKHIREANIVMDELFGDGLSDRKILIELFLDLSDSLSRPCGKSILVFGVEIVDAH